jgi:hypothetical protein
MTRRATSAGLLSKEDRPFGTYAGPGAAAAAAAGGSAGVRLHGSGVVPAGIKPYAPAAAP